MPHITEEIYSLYFKEKEKFKSIHISGWPKYDESFVDEAAEKTGDTELIEHAGSKATYRSENYHTRFTKTDW